MKKLLILTIIISTTMFWNCEEEIILPTNYSITADSLVKEFDHFDLININIKPPILYKNWIRQCSYQNDALINDQYWIEVWNSGELFNNYEEWVYQHGFFSIDLRNPEVPLIIESIWNEIYYQDTIIIKGQDAQLLNYYHSELSFTIVNCDEQTLLIDYKNNNNDKIRIHFRNEI
jgi:hypothetical protein